MGKMILFMTVVLSLLQNYVLGENLINVALYKPAWASSYHWSGSCWPEGAVNGAINDIGWCTNEYDSVHFSGWWVVDLQKIYEIKSLNVYNYGGSDAHWGTLGYHIDISNDNVLWTTVYSSQFLTCDWSHHTFMPDENISARYVRFYATSSRGTMGPCLPEMEVFASTCANPPRMDINDDCKVDLIDFAEFAREWLTCGFEDPSECWE